MKADIKAAWIKALDESYVEGFGETYQGREGLYNVGSDTYDALGVLCRILRIPTGYVRYDNMVSFDFCVTNPYDGSDEYITEFTQIPMEYLEEHDLMSANQAEEIIELNDNGVSFSDIAKWIKKHIGTEPFDMFKGPLETKDDND